MRIDIQFFIYPFRAVCMFIALALGMALASSAHAAIITWDGGGATENWTECANWSGNACPTSVDVATFDATSTKNATIDSGVTVQGVDINTGYSGTITQANGQTLTVGVSNFDQAAGTFTGGDATITITGSFVLSGGTFTSTSGNLRLQNNWTHTAGGTFNHNNGTLELLPASSNSVFDVATSETFYNFTKNKNSTWTTTISAGDSLIVLNAATLTDGQISAGSTTSFLEIRNTLSVGANFDYGSFNLRYSGSSDQSLSMPASSSWNPSNGLVIDKASGAFTLGSSLLLDCGGSGCNVTLTQGTFDANGYTVNCNDFTISAGTFTSGSVFVDIDDDLVINGGTWNASTDVTRVGGNFTVASGATFESNNGQFIFDRANNDGTYDVNVSESFENVTIDKGGFTVTITSGDTLLVTNTLTLTDGRFATGTIEMQGGTTIVGTNYDAPLTASTLKFTGSGMQTLTMQNPSYNNLGSDIVVDKSGGTLTLGAPYTSSSGRGFTLQNVGTFSTGGYDVSFQAYTQTGGVFNGQNSASVDHNATLTLSDGTYNATTGTTYFSSHLTQSGGTFAHNNGTVVLDSGSGMIYNVASSLSFYNLTMNKTSGSSGNISSGDVLIVENDLTCTDGRLLGTGSLDVRGNVTIGVNCDNVWTAPITFSGSNTQLFTLDAVNIIDVDITIDKTGGQVTQSGAFTLDCSGCDLFIREGTYDLNGSALTVSGAGTERLIVEDGGNLQLQGSEVITSDSASYPQLDSGSTVTYDGTSASYTLKNYTYHHLAIAGGANSVFALADNESLGGNLTITSGTLDQAGFTLAVTGTFANNGTLRRRQTETFTGTMDVDSGTVEYVGDGDGSVENITITDFGGTDYYNLKINDVNATKDTFTLGGGLVAAGTVEVTSSTFTQGAQTISAGGLTVNGGTFTGGSAALSVGNVTVSAGTLTATSDTFTVSGNWTHTAGGTFTHNSGTTVFSGNAATLDVATSETFAAVNINKNDGQTLTIASGDALLATGTLQLINGAVGTGTLEAQGAVTVQSGFDGGNAGLTFSGGNAQTFTLTGATGAFDGNITVAKSANGVTLASALVMDAAGQDLTVTSGEFSTGVANYGLTIADDLMISGGTVTGNGSVIDVNDDVTLSSGTLNLGTATVTIAGDISYTGGTLTPGTSSVTLDGGDQSITGTTTWHNLTKTASSAATLTLPASVTTTVEGTLVLSGSDGNLLSLRSSVPGSQATLDPSTFTSPSYLDVRDILVVLATQCLSGTDGCIDSGNNTGWTFQLRRSSSVRNVIDTPTYTLVVTSPNGDESYVVGERLTVTWRTTGNTAAPVVDVYLSIDGGADWLPIATALANNDVYSFALEDEHATNTARIKVVANDLIRELASDESDGDFIIAQSGVAGDDSSEILDEVDEIADRIAQLPDGVSVHGLVKLADDGDPATTVDSAVYYIGADGKRHAFPNEKVYFSWFCDFSSVHILSSESLAAIPVGANVTYRPGYRMIKFMSSPRVYAVNRFGILHWIENEAVARELYGEAWATAIDDVSDAFFGNYTFGSAIGSRADFNPTDVESGVAFPSDSFIIPGYDLQSSEGLSCAE